VKNPRLHRIVPALLFPALLGFASSPPPRPNTANPLPGHPDWAALVYADAAQALHRGDCTGAARALGPVLSTRGVEATFARVLSGLYAYACQSTAAAEERLYAVNDPDGALEDWRLFALARSAAAQGHEALAQTSLARLIGDYPDSVLRRRAMVEAANLAWKRGDARRALDLVDRGRRDRLKGGEATALETLAWQIATQLGNREGQVQAARRLLSSAPLVAADLKVAEVFRTAAGTLDLGDVLTNEELEARARALIAVDLAPNAVATLDAIAPAKRDLDWLLLRTQALVAGHRGVEALALLSGRQGATAAETAALEWARATAAADAAVARGGRGLTTAQRRQLRAESRLHYERVAGSGADPALAAKALRTLYVELMSDEQFEEGIDKLRRLRKLDARDATGAPYLWQIGWREYSRGNYTGAIGTWTELFALYPETTPSRGGRYWSARAFEALGETERAQQLYGEVARADTADFYRRNALDRLRAKTASPAAPSAAAPPAGDPARTEGWPNEPLLARARLLTDVGLDGLAQEEADAVGEAADRRAARALQAVVLARRGQLRESVLAIRDAFQSLGGPFQATVPEEARRLYYPVAYEDAIRSAAKLNGLPSSIVFGIIRQESAFDLRARSRAGAQGLMQVMPATGRELAGKLGLSYSPEALYDPGVNVQIGSSYFRQVLSMFDDNLELSLAGYNGGPFRIKRMWRESGYGDVDRFVEGLNLAEPIAYVKRILVLSDSYRQLYPQAG
jgi:soluble lytic murein transglycosylase-like protein